MLVCIDVDVCVCVCGIDNDGLGLGELCFVVECYVCDDLMCVH